MTPTELVLLSDQLTPELVPPPKAAADVCGICRSWRSGSGPFCRNCMQFVEELSLPCKRVVPVSLYSKPSALRDWLTFYKPGEEDEREEYGEHIGLILARYLLEHGAALDRWVGGVDSVCVVPSAERPGPHRLEEVYREHVEDIGPPLEQFLERGPGAVGHRMMSDDAFVVNAPVEERRVLLLDDVYTTGGTAQSAATALQLAGAAVPAVLVIGRRLNPDFDIAVKAIWERQAALPYDFQASPFWMDEC